MKRNLLFVILMATLIIMPARAAVTVEETTDAEYLINAGYSQVMAEDIFMQKNRVNGKPIEPLYETSDSAIVRGWKKFFSYLDPTQESVDRIHHDIKLHPSTSDL